MGPTSTDIRDAFAYHQLVLDESLRRDYAESSDSNFYSSSDFGSYWDNSDHDRRWGYGDDSEEGDGRGGSDDNNDSGEEEDNGEGEDSGSGEEDGGRELDIPFFRLSLEDQLTVDPTKSQLRKYDRRLACLNSRFSLDIGIGLLQRKLEKEDMGFLARLGQLCAQTEVLECKNPACLEKRSLMDLVAPACKWEAFRNWALVSMSCQATLRDLVGLT